MICKVSDVRGRYEITITFLTILLGALSDDDKVSQKRDLWAFQSTATCICIFAG